MTTAGIGQSNTSITYIRDGYYYDRGWMYDVQSSRLAQRSNGRCITDDLTEYFLSTN